MKKNNAIKVLHIVTGIDVSGVGTFLLSYYSKMDHANVHFDIVAIDKGREQLLEHRFTELGANIYYMPKPYSKRLVYLWRLLKDNKYDIVHSHIELASAVYLGLALLSGVKIRIAHAHMAFVDYSSFGQHSIRYLLNHVVTSRMGCSTDAINNLFGIGYKGIVIHNAIDIPHFSYNEEVRTKYRKELAIEDKYVVGFVGRLTYQKNIFYMLDIFNSFAKSHENAVLLIVGDGELKEAFFEKIDNLGIKQKIIYLGARNDVNNLMMAIDVMLLPSRWEGLGIVLIEAQAAGLKCITSKGTVPYNDTNISTYIHYCSIKASTNDWVNIIENDCVDYKKQAIDDVIRNHHYDINIEASRLADIYRNLMNKERI